MSFGVSDAVGDFEYNGASPNGLYAKRSHLLTPSFQRMVADLLRFNREARELLETSPQAWDPSLREYLDARGYSDGFVERLLVPQASAVWSADPAQMWSFPARFLVEFFDNHGMLGLRDRPQWRTVAGGSSRYVEALLDRLGRERLRLSTPVEAVARDDDGGDRDRRAAASRSATTTSCSPSTPTRRCGCSPTRASARPSCSGRSRTSATTSCCTPIAACCRAAAVPGRAGTTTSASARSAARPVTYHMNRLQQLDADRELCVTLNRGDDVRREHVIEEIAWDHPVFTAAGRAAQTRWEEIDGVRRTSYCGAYWGWGFHEDGVASAVRAVAKLGGRSLT